MVVLVLGLLFFGEGITGAVTFTLPVEDITNNQTLGLNETEEILPEEINKEVIDELPKEPIKEVIAEEEPVKKIDWLWLVPLAVLVIVIWTIVYLLKKRKN